MAKLGIAGQSADSCVGAMSEPIYAIGDIHGQLENLQQLHDLIADDRALHNTGAAKIVHVGDLVDRGPNSQGVVEYLRNGITTKEPWIVLKGNHDRLFYKYLEDPNWCDPRLRPDYTWLHPNMGGCDTLLSYGVDAAAQRDLRDLWSEAKASVPSLHRRFLEDLPLTYRHENKFFVHAGIRPGIAIDDQNQEDLLWIRQEFHAFKEMHPALIVHGHTPVDRATHYGNRINIDSGAGFGRPMTVIIIEGNRVFRLNEKSRRVPLQLAMA